MSRIKQYLDMRYGPIGVFEDIYFPGHAHRRAINDLIKEITDAIAIKNVELASLLKKVMEEVQQDYEAEMDKLEDLKQEGRMLEKENTK